MTQRRTRRLQTLAHGLATTGAGGTEGLVDDWSLRWEEIGCLEGGSCVTIEVQGMSTLGDTRIPRAL